MNTAPLARWNVGSEVLSVAVSPDNTRLASGSHDSFVRVWDVRTEALVLGPLKGHTDIIYSLAFSHDSTRIVSGSGDKNIRVWDARTGARRGKSLKGHTGEVYSVAFSHDSTYIISGSADMTIRIWDARTGAPVGEPLRGHINVVHSVAFSHDSTHIVSGSWDYTIRIWDARTGAPIGKPLKGHTGEVTSVKFSHDSTRIISGSGDGTIRIWDVPTGASIGEPLKGHTFCIFSIALSHDSTRIISGSQGKTIRVWDAHTGTPIGEPLTGHTGSVRSVAFSHDSTRIFSGSSDGTIRAWQAQQIVPTFDLGVVPSLPQIGSVLASEEAPALDMVSSSMSAKEMFECLVRHGCTDLTSSLDADRRPPVVIASGGFGVVRRAALIDGSFVALKTLRLEVLRSGGEKGVKRAVREVYLWSRLRHPHIQELLGIMVFQGNLGMVSPWREHGNLKDYIVAHSEVARHPLCVQLASAVAYLHSIEMVHGDLKSLNILVANDGKLKISDFDYAILSDTTLQFSATTRPGGGTLRWMAPELFQLEDDDEEGGGEVEDGGEPKSEGMRTKQTDVYALGMTILEIVTGALPYSEYKSEGKIVGAIYTRKPPRRPKELTGRDEGAERMWDLLLQCWRHNPSTRPDASSVLASLQGFVL